MIALSSMTISFGARVFYLRRSPVYQNEMSPCTSLSPVYRQNAGGNRAGLMTSGSVILVALVSQPFVSAIACTKLCSFSGLGVIVGLNVRSLESVALYNNFVIIPMSFLSDVF